MGCRGGSTFGAILELVEGSKGDKVDDSNDNKEDYEDHATQATTATNCATMREKQVGVIRATLRSFD